MTSSYFSEVTHQLAIFSYERHDARVVHLLSFVVGVLTAWTVAQVIYRIWFHPLSKYPGPIVYAVSAVPYMYQNYIQGQWVPQTSDLHRKYGPIVRIGPNHISVDGEFGWPQVFGRRKADQIEYEKQPVMHKAKAHSLIVAPRDVHRRQRRQLNHAFSDAALTRQEDVIQQYADLLIDRLQARASKGEAVDIVKWFNCTTFDIIGDLAFSESFVSLRNNDLHPWINFVFATVKVLSFRRFFAQFPMLRLFLSMFSSKFGTKQHSSRDYVKEKARRRMVLGEVPPSGRRDFMSYMLRKTRDGEIGMSDNEMLETSPTIVLAGSETTASALSGLFFYLAKHPRVYEQLIKVIRNAFDNEDEITMQKTSSIEYLVACINEILRIYPPAAETPTRISPGDFIEGTYIPPGTEVAVYQWATFRNPKHFKDPDSFIPERWLAPSHPRYDARFRDDNHAVFKPFSYGPRDCIGKNLAMAELRLVICRVLYRFDYEMLDGQDDWHSSQRVWIVWEKGPLMVRLKPRLTNVAI